MNHWTPLRMPNDWTLLNWSKFHGTRILITASNSSCYSDFPLPWNVLIRPLPSNGLFRVYSLQWERVFGEPLVSNGLQLRVHYSCFQASLNILFYGLFYIRLHTVVVSIYVRRAAIVFNSKQSSVILPVTDCITEVKWDMKRRKLSRLQCPIFAFRNQLNRVFLDGMRRVQFKLSAIRRPKGSLPCSHKPTSG
jgi:hypothetical protein